ncbi:MAG TPA: trypsin-like peptidase domain-containing protein [Rectinemataceae bacterium]|nr:trypsin-like peptidase domain-containing protein [Rectinemataceae bacterium]
MKRPALAALVALSVGLASTAQSALPPGLADRVRSTVVEVVRAKNSDRTMEYVEAPPADLIPFAERNDPWQAVGTAFSLGGDRFATAAHVLSLDAASESETWAIRFSDGRVCPIGRLFRYSSTRDFAEFEAPGAKAPALSLDSTAAPNSRVYAAGNALGQGIVTRDGIFTSTTPEEASGAWRWIRFSAAASPGNSGGPLLDETGRVVGLVVAKSENENLNYALPAAELDKVPEGRLEYSATTSWSIPVLTAPLQVHASLAHDGALSLAEARSLAIAARDEAFGKALAESVSAHPETLFPLAPGASALLDSPAIALFPQLAAAGDNGIWSLTQPDKINESPLADGAKLRWGTRAGLTFFDFAKAKGEDAASYAKSPDAVMRRYLAGSPLYRSVGGRDFRISSFGRAVSNERFRDNEGRLWVLAAWIVPELDFVELACYLPTPSGFAGFAEGLGRADLTIEKERAKALAGFIQLGYSASAADWGAYLGSEDFRPSWLDGASLAAAHGPGLAFSSGAISFRLDENSPGMADDSVISLSPWWFPDGAKGRKYSFAIFLAYSPSNGYAFTEVFKQPKPGPSATDANLNLWKILKTGASPFTMLPYDSGGNTYESGILDLEPGADPDFIYGLSLRLPGTQQSAKISSVYPIVRATINVSEAERRAGKLDKAKLERPRIGGFDIFESIAAGDEDSFAAFLAVPSSLSLIDATGDSPLGFALRLGKPDMATRLLAAGAPVDLRDGHGDTPLLLAMRGGDLDLARAIVAATKEPDLASPSGAGPLVLSMPAAFGMLPELILAAGASPSSPANALAVGAALAAGRMDLAKRLVEAGFPMDAVYPGGWGVLLFAIEAGDPDAALWFLDKGAPAGLVTDDGHDALIEALRLGQRAVADRLIAAGADWNGRTEDGWTPLLLACRQGYATEAFALIGAGAPILGAGPGGLTSLHEAATSFSPSDLRKFLDLGASLLEDARDDAGHRPADLAAAKGLAKSAALLAPAKN